MKQIFGATAAAVALVASASAAKDANTIYNECLSEARNWFSDQMTNRCGRRTQQTAAMCETEVRKQHAEITKRCGDTLNASTARAAAQTRENTEAAERRRARTPPRSN